MKLTDLKITPVNVPLEDPVWRIDAMARLRKEIHVPFSTNMCVVCFEDIPLSMRAGAVDVIPGDPRKWGGKLQFKNGCMRAKMPSGRTGFREDRCGRVSRP